MNRVLAIAGSVPKSCVRRFSTTEVQLAKPDLTKIKKKQMHFQADNDVPVYLKGGPMDFVLYAITAGLIFIGLASSARSAYNLAVKK